MAMIDDIVETLIEELREMQNGTEATIAQLVSKCGYGARQLERDDQMLTIYSELLKAARKAHITLDWSEYKDMVVAAVQHSLRGEEHSRSGQVPPLR